MDVDELRLAGLKLVRPRVFHDDRGFFVESFRAERYLEHGIRENWVQDNHSRSVARTLRGMHFQTQPGQAKLVRVGRGRIFDVAVDIRPSSPTFGQWEGVELDDQQHHQLYVPVGFAHGFCVLSDEADVLYKVSSPFDAATEASLAWDDPEVGIAWPVEDPILSTRDQQAPSLATLRRASETSGD